MADSPTPPESSGQLVPDAQPTSSPVARVEAPRPIIRLNLDGYSQDDGAWQLLWMLTRCVLRYFWPVVLAFCGLLGWLLKDWLDMHTKVNSVDSLVEAKVAAKADDIRKELATESKEKIEELAQLKEALEYDQFMYEFSCKGDYEFVLSSYTAFAAKLKPKEIPALVRPRMHRIVVGAVFASKRYAFLSGGDTESIEATLKKETTLCANHLTQLSLIHAANGNYEKAFASVNASLDTIWDQPAGDLQDTFLTQAYAACLLFDLQRQKGSTKERVDATWGMLTRLEGRKLAKTGTILNHIETAPMRDVVDRVMLREGAVYSESLTELKKQLATRGFLSVPVEDLLPNGTKVIRYMVVERKENTLVPIPEPQLKKNLPEC